MIDEETKSSNMWFWAGLPYRWWEVRHINMPRREPQASVCHDLSSVTLEQVPMLIFRFFHSLQKFA